MAKTYPRVVELLKKEFDEKKISKYSFCKETGINPTSVAKYLSEISEPTQKSLEKLACYFGVSVAWLRGEEILAEHIVNPTQTEELKNSLLEIEKLQRELEISRQREKLIQEKLDCCMGINAELVKYANFAMYSFLIARIQRDNIVYELERRNADIVLSLERKGTPPEKVERSANKNAKKVLKSINKRPKNWDSVLKQEDKNAYQDWINTLTTIPSLVYVGDAFNSLELREERWEYF